MARVSPPNKRQQVCPLSPPTQTLMYIGETHTYRHCLPWEVRLALRLLTQWQQQWEGVRMQCPQGRGEAKLEEGVAGGGQSGTPALGWAIRLTCAAPKVD